MKVKIKILGKGTHALMIKSIIEQSKNYKFNGFTNIYNLKNIKKENHIIGIGDLKKREEIIKKFKSKFFFKTIIDQSSNICKNVKIGNGTLIAKGCIINNKTTIGENCIINTGSIIEHDCVIENNVHIGPGSIICGNSKIRDNVFIGAGSIIINNISISKNVIIGAFSNVIKNITKPSKYVGNPAKLIKSSKRSCNIL